MRAYFCLCVILGSTVWACGGSPFTSGNEGGRAGESAAGVGSGASPSGGSDTAGSPGAGGSNPVAGSASMGGTVNVGGLGIAGDLVVAGTAPTAGEPGTAGSGPDPVAQSCPKTQPSAGAGCADGLSCSYGKDLRPDCRVRAKCDGGTWAIDDPGCEPLPACESIEPGSMCDDSVARPCAIEGYIYCVCCSAGPSSGDCPHVMPNEGQTCVGDAACSYGSCATDSRMDVTCNGAAWDWTSAQCPQ
jgi:hypothetical protein